MGACAADIHSDGSAKCPQYIIFVKEMGEKDRNMPTISNTT